MPGGNGTGPSGMGPRTGRGAGYCSGYATPGYMNPVQDQSYWGCGRGNRRGGRGRAYGFRGITPGVNPYPIVENETYGTGSLENLAKSLENSLNNIKRQIAELKTRKQTD
ncbi:MAG: DUF5320 domain-containing protein [Syntrophomonadaceae bacterium]|nr:DUF5320 domain-containing protein [Syntrophomonadaceae bacterium]MDD4549643.1 DUF5320 domain-containing protein [Syntrophomonadaceae bacterium]